MKEVRTVIWDCDNIMWFHKKEQIKIFTAALKISEIEEFETQFFNMLETIDAYFSKIRVTKTETYKIIEKQMPILDFYGISPKYFMNVWCELKCEINDFNEDTLTVMKYLREKGVKNIVKTDWWRNIQEGMLKKHGVLEYIEELHCCDGSYLKCNPLSAQGIIKPGKEEQYVIIGDSLMSDIAFANNAGINSIWLNREKIENATQYEPTFEITSLLEVMEIL